MTPSVLEQYLSQRQRFVEAQIRLQNAQDDVRASGDNLHEAYLRVVEDPTWGPVLQSLMEQAQGDGDDD